MEVAAVRLFDLGFLSLLPDKLDPDTRVRTRFEQVVPQFVISKSMRQTTGLTTFNNN
jgi:hypothetical protein